MSQCLRVLLRCSRYERISLSTVPLNHALQRTGGGASLDNSGVTGPPVPELESLGIIHITPNMKIRLVSVLFFCSLLLAGCTSSSCKSCKSTSPAATTKSSVYDPATDTTTIKNGGYSWYLKGNHTNMMLEARP